MSNFKKMGYMAFAAGVLSLAPILSALAAPTVPANLTATSTAPTSITLNWSASTGDAGVLGYKIYRDGATTSLASLSSTTLTYTDQGLDASSTHTYAVASFDSAGDSALSTSASITTLADADAPAVPTGLTATPVSNTQINLSWATSSDNVEIEGYKIFRNSVQIATATSNSFNDTGLTASTPYVYAISAFDETGNVSELSATATATTLATATVPTVKPGIRIIGHDDHGRLINMRSNAKIKVVVFASESFDPKTIIASSATLAGAHVDKKWKAHENRDKKVDMVFDFRVKDMTDLIDKTATGTMPITFKAVTQSGQQISYTANIRVKDFKFWKDERLKERKAWQEAKKKAEALKKKAEDLKKKAEEVKKKVEEARKKAEEAKKKAEEVRKNQVSKISDDMKKNDDKGGKEERERGNSGKSKK